MVMGVVDSRSRLAADDPAARPELLNTRVLITRVGSDFGLSLARAFAATGCRVVIDPADPQPPRWLEHDDGRASAIRTAQRAPEVFGGIDLCVSLVRLRNAVLPAGLSPAECEEAIAAVLRAPFHATRVLGGRMRLTRNEGQILNVVVQERAADPAASALGGLVRAALAAMTRLEAAHWAADGIRVNTIGPADPGAGGSEDQVARLALQLTARRSGPLSGIVFDPALVPPHECC